MPQCPVCETEYTEGQMDSCSVCAWSLKPHTLAMKVSPTFLERENDKLVWAKRIWHQVKNQQDSILGLDRYQAQLSALQKQLEISQAEEHRLKSSLDNPKSLLQIARKSLSQWINELSTQLAAEVLGIPTQENIMHELNLLIRFFSGTGSRTDNQELLQIIKVVLESDSRKSVEEIAEQLRGGRASDPITRVDALLDIYQELRLKGIIKRDRYGDTLYDS
jgi:hypothetical protein